MNLIYLRPAAPKAEKFVKKKLRGGAPRPCLAPAPAGRGDCLVTFLNDVSPGMLEFIYRTGGADPRLG